MSEIQAKIVKVEILPHPNADKLQIARIGGEGGFESVVGMGQFSTGDLALYIPVGAIIPKNIQDWLKEKSKIDVEAGRIRCAKIRGVFSEGLCLTPSLFLPPEMIIEDKDATEFLGIKKYEPPEDDNFRSILGINKHKAGKGNRNFIEYTCVEKGKKYSGVWNVNELVVITKKYHGTNHRAGLVKKEKQNIWDKVKNFFGFGSKLEFLVGSHKSVYRLNEHVIKDNKYNLYWKAALKYNLHDVVNKISQSEAINYNGIAPEVVIYSEIIGPKIQKGYDYGITSGDFEIRVFDIMINKKYQNWDKVLEYCSLFNLPAVDEIWRGPWNIELIKMADANDIHNGKTFVREGIVIRSAVERISPKCGRVIMKYINPRYELDKTNSEFH